MTTPTTKIIAEHGMYEIRVENVKSQLTLDGTDQVYAVLNKETGVVEGRGANLPETLTFMYSLQVGYDNITKQAQAAQHLENGQGSPPEHTGD